MQEALANVARHSEAGKVEISLVYAQKEISLTVTDDGHGYGTDAKGGGFGLSSMQDRAQSAGGKLTVESVLEKVTTVTCTLPAGEWGENSLEKAHG